MADDGGEFIAGIIAIVISCLAIFGIYWVAKTVSYQIFYEDMVKQTISQMVKPEYIKTKYYKGSLICQEKEKQE